MLKILALQNNSIFQITNDSLKCLTNLEELYLSSNNLTLLDGLESQAKSLKILDLGNNSISDLSYLSSFQFSSLEEIWLNNNLISSFDQLKGLKQMMPKLRCIYLENNPISQNPRYIAIVKEFLPQVSQIDAAIFSLL